MGNALAWPERQPQAGLAPTRSWTPGEVLKDSYVVPILDQAEPGEYYLIAGLYEFSTGRRLSIVSSQTNYVTLASITINR